VNQDLKHIWSGIQAELRRALSDATYDIWLAPLEPTALAGSPPVLTVQAPAEIRAWVSERFGDALARAAHAAGFDPLVVEIVSGPVPGASIPARNGRPARKDAGSGAAPPMPEPPPAALNPKFTFGQFVIGDANRFAHAAALAVAELPGQAYNPLFIYGPPGVGKTHLLHSIGNYVQRYGEDLTVRYATVEQFTNDFVGALQSGSNAVDRFKGRYRRNDVLLVDDIQFLESKAKTEEEFFHTFNALLETGSQLVLTSDRLPRDLGALEDRLRERFEAGLVTDIQSPDRATRLTVLTKRVDHDGIAVQDGAVLEVIADRITSNIRALEGALIRVVAFASLTGRPVDPDLATEVLDGLYGREGGAPGTGGRRGPLPRVSVAHIQAVICDAFSITHEELVSPSRTARVTWPRQVAMYLAREHTDETLPAIGRQFGNRGHTTVMHAVRRASERLAQDPDAYETVRGLTARITAGSDRQD
jgi:chromosomal replication initiator protein